MSISIYKGNKKIIYGEEAIVQKHLDILRKILKTPNAVNFKQAASIRSQLLLLERTMGANKNMAKEKTVIPGDGLFLFENLSPSYDGLYFVLTPPNERTRKAHESTS